MIDKKISHESVKSDCVSVGKKQKKEEKKQEKLSWSQDLQTDLVDIISNNKRYRRKLSFTNSKYASNAEVYECMKNEIKKRCAERNEQFLHNVTQTRNKFKKLMSICKAALPTQKTASGIKRFQDQQEYGQWFDVLVPLMKKKTKVSCQPEQVIEPNAGECGASSLDPESSVGSDVTVDPIDQAILDGLPEMTKSRSAPEITSDS